MKKLFLFPFIAVLLAFFITSCSSDNSGSTTPSASESVTILSYFPVTNLEKEDTMTLDFIDKENYYKIGSPNLYIKNMMENINDANTKIYVMAGAGNLIHKETNPNYDKYPVKDFTKNYQYKITKNNLEILNSDTAKVSCYDGVDPVNLDAIDIDKCEDMSDVEVISDFFVKGIKENKTDKYVAIFNLHGGGSIVGMGYPPYLSSFINAEKFGQIFEKIREKLGQPDFKFDTIIMISCLMGNAEFMHTVKDYANYYIGSESSQPVLSWNLSKYIQEVGKGYNSINAGNAILDSFKDMTDHFSLYSDINMVDLTKLEDVSKAFDNMSAALQINYDKGDIDKAKTINNIFLSAYNAVNYGNGQVDLFTFAERLGYNDEYYTDDYTAVKNELQTVVNNALVRKEAMGIYKAYNGGISFAADPLMFASSTNKGFSMGNIDFAPQYLEFMKKISDELVKIKNSKPVEITESYDNGLIYTVKSPIAITSAQVDVGDLNNKNSQDNRVGSLVNIFVPDPVYDEATNMYTYTLNFNNPETEYIFTLNDSPIRVSNTSNGFYSPDREELYFSTTETRCVSAYGENSTCKIFFKYNIKTKKTEISQVTIGFRVYSFSELIQNFSKIKIEPFSENQKVLSKANSGEFVIPSYEINIDKTQVDGGISINAKEYIIKGNTPVYRLSYGTVAYIGIENANNTSPWKTLDEIKASTATQAIQ